MPINVARSSDDISTSVSPDSTFRPLLPSALPGTNLDSVAFTHLHRRGGAGGLFVCGCWSELLPHVGRRRWEAGAVPPPPLLLLPLADAREEKDCCCCSAMLTTQSTNDCLSLLTAQLSFIMHVVFVVRSFARCDIACQQVQLGVLRVKFLHPSQTINQRGRRLKAGWRSTGRLSKRVSAVLRGNNNNNNKRASGENAKTTAPMEKSSLSNKQTSKPNAQRRTPQHTHTERRR